MTEQQDPRDEKPKEYRPPVEVKDDENADETTKEPEQPTEG